MLNKLLLLVAAALVATTTDAVRITAKDLSTVAEPVVESCLAQADSK